jgi:tetratricopeptide (TPR) repeat protein
MFKYLCAFVLFLCSCLVPHGANSQTTVQPPEPKPTAPGLGETKADYSKEAFVDEDDASKVSFENDGTSTRDTSTRIRIQSDAAIERYGVLTFPYQTAIESVDIKYVRVRKPDGSVIATPTDSAQDMPSEITRQAPFYSDLHEKHVAVKGLAVGDVLEYAAQFHVTKALAPGQFWTTFSFSHDFIALHDVVQIIVPRERVVKWKSPKYKPVITEDGSRRIFTWANSELESKSQEQQKKDNEEQTYQAARGKLPPPDIQISSFSSWEEVGAWYNKLQLERVAPTSEIRAKALELTKNAADDNTKLHAIYNYVSTQFRYIGVAFGIGRYQPHAAAEVLANQYGDCKDKHTLLASLLDAAGIKAYPALISTYRELDPDVPSPAQFDHVITTVPQGRDFIWLDTTAEVAPFGYLLSLLRDKSALVIPPDRAASLVSSPAEPANPGVQTFTIEGKLDDTGTLQATVNRSISGDDTEVLLRMAFRRTPLTQWRELAQKISYASGFSGDVSEVTASSPEKTDEPFHLSYKYNRKDFPDWADRKIATALPPILGTAPEEKPSHPIILGALGKIEYLSQVELPRGYSPQLPTRVSLKEDFAEYHATYSVNKGVLQAERELVVKMHEVPVAEYEAYTKFSKKVADDYALQVALSSPTDMSPATLWQNALWSLPASDNAEAAKLQDKAMADSQSGDTSGAIAALKQAVKLDPKFARGWLLLAAFYAYTREDDEALVTLRQANDSVPNQPIVYKALVATLMGLRKYEDAVAVLQTLVKDDPSNIDALSTLGSALFQLKRYGEAATILESAVKLAPDRAGLDIQLGQAYLKADDEQNAVAAFKKAVEIDASPLMFNDAGYYLADANKQLPLALEYVGKAVNEEEVRSSKVTLSEMKKEDLAYPGSLAAYWDSLGWVYFRQGNYSEAERYLNASWHLSQGSTEADHLGQVYEQEHKKQEAVRMYRLAMAAARPYRIKDTEERLERLGGALKTGRLGESGAEELTNMRTFHLPRLTPDDASAEFFVLFVKGGKIEDVKFLSGSDRLKSADTALRAPGITIPLPDDGPTHLVRRGVLGCYKTSGCSFVLYRPYDVHSVD